MRQAVACAVGEHPIRIPYIDPYDYGVNFYKSWEEVVRQFDHRLQRASRDAAEVSGRYWIAIVPSLQSPPPTTHAVVMLGKKLHFDCARKKPRQRAPRVLRANPLVLVPTTC